MSAPYKELEQPLNDSALVCRACLSESGEMKNMFEWGLMNDYYLFTGVQLIRTEGLSDLICLQCEDKLAECRNFRAQCQGSDAHLKAVTCDMINSNFTSNSANVNDNNIMDETAENTTSCMLLDNRLIITIIAPDMEAKIYLPCPFQCQEKFQKKRHLLLHLTKQHDVSAKFEIQLQYYCSVTNCGYASKKHFTERKYLNQHYHKMHRNKYYACPICASSYSKLTDYTRHLTSCSLTFNCTACGKNYKTNDRLLVHLMRKHPEEHAKYKQRQKRKSETITESKKPRVDYEMCDSPKRSFATQTLRDNIKNDVALPPWVKSDFAKTDEISTQTVFEDLLSLKSNNSEDDTLFFADSVSDIQTQTFPLEFGLSRVNKETLTSETQSPDLSIKETQTCFCLYDSPKVNYRLFDSVNSSPSSTLTSTETQTSALRSNVTSDVLLCFNSAETQTNFDGGFGKDSL